MTQIVYLDSSTLVSVICADERGMVALERMKKGTLHLTSALSEVEVQAGICATAGTSQEKQLVLEQNFNQVFSSINLITLHHSVLQTAKLLVRRYKNSLGLRTLDALHVATAREISRQFSDPSQVTFLTSDKRQYDCALAEGFEAILV